MPFDERRVEAILRDHGYSRTVAKAAIAAAKRAGAEETGGEEIQAAMERTVQLFKSASLKI